MNRLLRFVRSLRLTAKDIANGVTPYVGLPKNGNIGDEFLYLLAQRHLRRVNLIPDLSSRGRFIRLSLERANGFYFVGGGSLIFGRSFISKFKKYSDFGLTPVFWGTGSRELPFDINEQEKWRSLLSNSQGGVRGYITAESFQKLGFDVDVIGDMGFLVSLDYPGISLPENYALIVPRLVNNRNPDLRKMDLKRLEKLKILMRKFHAQGLKNYIYLPSEDDPRDLTEWLSSVKSFSHILNYTGGAQSFLNLARRASIIVTMRLHPGIFGYALGVPVIFIESREKYYDAISILANKPLIIGDENFSDADLFKFADELIREPFKLRTARQQSARAIALNQLEYSQKIEAVLVYKACLTKQ